MNRLHLAILVISALLSTSVQPLAWIRTDGANVPKSAEPAPRPTVLVRAPAPDARATLEAERTDAELATELARRLSYRHTGLPAHERAQLARTIIREARAQDLDPDLVIAVIEVESAGYHLAVSHVGAMGLMQLMPATGEELARKHEVEWMGNDTLFDPTINVKLGTAYLRQLADRYGNVAVALAAYNWGPGAIDRRIRRGDTVPSKYIEQVMRAYDRDMSLGSTRS